MIRRRFSVLAAGLPLAVIITTNGLSRGAVETQGSLAT